MATSKPRITITLEPRSYEVLSRMAKAGGESMSQVVTSLVDMAVPSFERAVAIVERAHGAGEEVRAGIKASLDRAEREMLPTLLNAVKQSDMFLGEVERASVSGGATSASTGRTRAPAAEGAGKGAAPVAGGRRGESTPVPVTRGSGGIARGAEASKKRVKG